MNRFDVVIVGAGQSGAHAAMALRQRKFQGTIALVGEEPDYPYDRQPLSKEYLAGEKTFERIMLRPASYWQERQIELQLGTRATEIDPVGRSITTRFGETIGYRQLIWAAGGSPRQLACSGANLNRVHSIRSRLDVDRLIAELPGVRRVGVIGGGYIGLEAASVLRKLGQDVVVLETLDRVLARVAAEPISRFFEAQHREHGVEVRTGASIERIEEENDAASGIRLLGGEVIPVEMIIVGIGIQPNIEPLAGAGAMVSDGVHVDEHCRTTLPDVFAIGDCALHASRYADGAWIRLESVQNANDQAQTVARWLTGDPQPYETVPWFWSDQYDLKLQTVGLSTGFDELVVRGDPETRSFSVVYLKDGRIIALDCVNDTKDYVQGRALVSSGAMLPLARLSDRSITLKELAA